MTGTGKGEGVNTGAAVDVGWTVGSVVGGEDGLGGRTCGVAVESGSLATHPKSSKTRSKIGEIGASFRMLTSTLLGRIVEGYGIQALRAETKTLERAIL